MKKGIIILFFSVLALFENKARAQSYEQVSALVHISIYEQHDTIGYNLVNAIPYLFYDHIMKGHFPLWDSPKKERQITPSILAQLEKGNGAHFTTQDALFLNEVWTTDKKKTQFEILGFSFVGRNSQDSTKFNYGFVEMKDVEAILKTEYIPVNINGSYQTTYYQALMHRTYSFNLMQLGGTNFKDYRKSLAEKNKAFSPKKKITSFVAIPERKFISCRIDKELASVSPAAKEILESFNTYYQANMAIFLNNGGASFVSHLNTKYKVNINRIEFSSVWEKKDKIISTDPEYLLVYADDHLLDTIYMTQLKTYPITINMKPIADYIRGNTFDVVITQINETNINVQDSKRFLEALRSYKWNRVSEYVIPE